MTARSGTSHHRFVRRRLIAGGMGMIELMLSLTICALLLVGVAAAFSATARAIETNDEFSRAAQSARVSVNQVMALTRQCKSAFVSNTSLELTLADDSRQLYALNTTARELRVTLESQTPPRTYTLARNVDALKFASGGKSITMMVTITVGDNSIILTGSTVPRRLVEYK